MIKITPLFWIFFSPGWSNTLSLNILFLFKIEMRSWRCEDFKIKITQHSVYLTKPTNVWCTKENESLKNKPHTQQEEVMTLHFAIKKIGHWRTKFPSRTSSGSIDHQTKSLGQHRPWKDHYATRFRKKHVGVAMGQCFGKSVRTPWCVPVKGGGASRAIAVL